jgi:hypothetical protein
LDKVRKVFNLNEGDDAVFGSQNGAPRIMTKFRDKPYSYELLPEYAEGSILEASHGKVDELGR